jgi:hypothetical protein
MKPLFRDLFESVELSTMMRKILYGDTLSEIIDSGSLKRILK